MLDCRPSNGTSLPRRGTPTAWGVRRGSICRCPIQHHLLPRGLFIPRFLRFTIPQVRRTSSPVLGVEHSWARYRFHIAQRLRSTVPVVCRLPRYQPFWRPLPILLDFQCAFLRNGACLSTQHIPHSSRCKQLSRPCQRACRCCSAGCRYPRNHFS